MAFFKKQQKKINGKWYPQVVTVGKPVTTDEVADRLSKISTVSRADTYAVLKDLADVLSDYMAQGRTVKLEGLGTFYYGCPYPFYPRVYPYKRKPYCHPLSC